MKKNRDFGNLPPTIGRMTLVERVDVGKIRCKCSCKVEATYSVGHLRAAARDGIDLCCRACSMAKLPPAAPKRVRRERYVPLQSPLCHVGGRGS